MRRSTHHFVYVLLLAIAPVLGCDDDDNDNDEGPNVTESQFYAVDNLVSDLPNRADHVDPMLVNPWGIAFGPQTAFWVANEGTDTATIYDAQGRSQSAAIGGPVVMEAPLTAQASGPTGVVFNPTGGFRLAGTSRSSVFIFATTGGTILGWNPDIAPTNAVVAVDNSNLGASYTGLTLAETSQGTRLYAADFTLGQVEVYNDAFQPATGLASDAFIDPDLPDNYVPFNVHALGNRIFVMYALQDEKEPDEEVLGSGLGIVNMFDETGEFMGRVASHGDLNAPWGIAEAPSRFGKFGNALLVGNFGDGRITAFDPDDFEELGQLETSRDKPIEIEGLWTLVFGNGGSAGGANELFFSAGIDDEMHGLFGRITPIVPVN